MFDDFMHNDFPDMHFNQAQQDAMLHAQQLSHAADQHAQQAANDTVQVGQHSVGSDQPIQFTSIGNIAMNLGLLVQAVIEKLLGERKP